MNQKDKYLLYLNYTNFIKMKKTSTAFVIVLLFIVGCFLVFCTKKPGIDEEQKEPPTTEDSTSGPESPGAFIHPGILNTNKTLDFIRSEANNPSTARYSDYQTTVVDYTDKTGMPASFPAVVTVKSSGTTPTEVQIKENAQLAYALALRFAATGDTAYSHKAKIILNGWSYNFDHYDIASGTTPGQPYLEASWVAPTFAAAAEIIRHYKPDGHSANWPAADINQFETFLKNLDDNYISKTIPSGHHSNWIISEGYAKVAIGVFLDNRTIYNEGLSILLNYMNSVIYSDGQMPELCSRKDCIHFQYSLDGLTYAAEIAREQNQNILFTNNRLLLAYDFMWKAFHGQFSCQHCSSKNAVLPAVEVANRYYNSDKIDYLSELQPPYGVPSINFLGFTTYTHKEVPIEETGGVSSTLFSKEDFDYGSTAANLVDVSNWTVFSGSEHPVGYVSPGLTFSGYTGSDKGGAATFENGTDSRQDVEMPVSFPNTGKIYAAMMINLQNASTDESGDFFFSFRTESGSYFNRLYVKANSSGHIIYGISRTHTDDGATVFVSSSDLTFNHTYLVVVKYDFSTQKSELFIIQNEIPAEEPDEPDAEADSGTIPVAFDQIIIRQNQGDIKGTIDGIRIANTWKEAVGLK